MPGPWGRALKQLRLQKGLTRQTVAKRAGMTPSTYGKIELGGHTLTSQLQDLADVFKVPLEDVLIAPEERVGRVELERRLRIAIAVAMQPMEAPVPRALPAEQVADQVATTMEEAVARDAEDEAERHATKAQSMDEHKKRKRKR